MEIGIIGLAQSGKTALFRALIGGGGGAGGARRATLGAAKIPDQRLQRLSDLVQPKKTTPAEVTFVDIPGAPEGLGLREGIGGEFLNRLQSVDALLMVVRAFEDPSVSHIQGNVDPYRDLDTIQMELAYSDLAILERRAKRLEGQLKSAKAQEREAAQREQALVERVKGRLDEGIPLRAQDLGEDERRMLEQYQFLSAKPLLAVMNIGEEQMASSVDLEAALEEKISGPGVGGVVLAAKLEAELTEMLGEEEAEFRASLGAGEPGVSRVARLAYSVLGLISFFTVSPEEVRAWTSPVDVPAVKAAGKVHSDMERGFVRAEVVPWDVFLECGGLAEAKKRGLARSEGKGYEVKDGEVVQVLFTR